MKFLLLLSAVECVVIAAAQQLPISNNQENQGNEDHQKHQKHQKHESDNNGASSSAASSNLLAKWLDQSNSLNDMYPEEGSNQLFKRERRTICYGELGCFDNSIADTLPSEPDSVPPVYYLSTKDTAEVKLSWNDTTETIRTESKGFFTKDAPLIFIAHGFGQTLGKLWLQRLRWAVIDAYTEANIIVIDWGKACYLPFYFRAAANVPLVANMTVKLVTKLMAEYPSIKAENIYFIGYSLGAQMAGYFARSFAAQTHTKIGRITALDAAGPMFESMHVAPRRGDAEFVEALHTSIGLVILSGQFGYIQPYADIDYYPNRGSNQPGCSPFEISCSHQRAPKFYTAALNSLDTCHMKGVTCASLTEVKNGRCTGPEIDAYIGMKHPNISRRDNNQPLIVYLQTSSSEPFCLSRTI